MPKQNLQVIANYLQLKNERSSYITIEVNETASEIIIRGLHFTDYFIQHICRVARTEALNFTISSALDPETKNIFTRIIIYSL
jgi:hypothetical protein